MTSKEARYYTEEHNPKYWGFFLWNAWEAQLESYPPQDPTPEEQKELRLWMWMNFRKIPCEICREDALPLLQKYPIATTSRAAAIEWLHFIHNMVNEKLGKRALSPEEAHASSQLVRHVNWANVWSDLKADKLNVGVSYWRTYTYMAFFLMLMVFVAVFVVWLKDSNPKLLPTKIESMQQQPIFVSPAVK